MIDAHVTDRAALAARSPGELALYLRSRAWQIRDRDATGAYWVLVAGGEEFEALQPTDAGLRDYGARVLDVLRVLSIVEDRSELDVLRDMTNVSMDIHTVRTFPVDSPPGMIGLDDGVQALESVRNLVLAAAYSVGAEQQKAVQPARKPAEVLRFLRDVRIGPSAEGSFVMSVHTPIPPRLTSGHADDADDGLEPSEPFQRRVTLRLYDAVVAARDAANEALVSPDGLDAFTASVRHGMSANLCEALVGIGGGSGHPFEISLSLAPSRPMLRRRLSPIRFRRDHLPVLTAAAQELRERIAEDGVTVFGNVVRLHRVGTGSGEISIAGTVEGDDRLRRFWTHLPEQDYLQATRAHEQMLGVSVRGDLLRRGTRLYLKNPVAFRTLPEGDTDEG
ncbi:hypothetical protein J2S43_007148 [Catenuloplanes nepalensis]|uniref:Uncharacterized protein n=1 Tax=Catenuloplanes nepalensis TaxID=587533 RepID=A0ABT9N5W6_9ACTN|nr:hypothetical protein [Catenuloplanes nepalensis]MDP9798636.1 hypothetical protein [Catenuloplanes nepalensis]